MKKLVSKASKEMKKFIGKCMVVIQDKYLEEKVKYKKDSFKYLFWLSIHLIIAILSIILLPQLSPVIASAFYFMFLRLSS